jgi:hypothetical protein
MAGSDLFRRGNKPIKGRGLPGQIRVRERRGIWVALNGSGFSSNDTFEVRAESIVAIPQRVTSAAVIVKKHLTGRITVLRESNTHELHGHTSR